MENPHIKGIEFNACLTCVFHKEEDNASPEQAHIQMCGGLWEIDCLMCKNERFQNQR